MSYLIETQCESLDRIYYKVIELGIIFETKLRSTKSEFVGLDIKRG